MIVRLFDKFVFALLFIAALQVPILADHYRQYLTGYYDATRDEVNAIAAMAQRHGYVSASALLESLAQNSEPVVREDAKRKAAMFEELIDIEAGIRTLTYGHYFEKLGYMFTPTRTDTLARVVTNFKPAIPLTPASLAFSLLTAILVNVFLWSPYFCYCGIRKLRRRQHHPA
ncbi:DUF2937 family protein [Alteromonas sp. 345S023]|uniref:DUF2937 family protein n=1 Tax=Alteromonas profundi TaxID=2696062 RepID=A0A7X5RKF3_9ALTE|nr:DUF2937 family protein [Alteromonas profundi]NDV90933.1 DUF2937 family protein [Alteromonas profundi]